MNFGTNVSPHLYDAYATSVATMEDRQNINFVQHHPREKQRVTSGPTFVSWAELSNNQIQQVNPINTQSHPSNQWQYCSLDKARNMQLQSMNQYNQQKDFDRQQYMQFLHQNKSLRSSRYEQPVQDFHQRINDVSQMTQQTFQPAQVAAAQHKLLWK